MITHITYKDWEIEPDSIGYTFTHKNYDGPEDARIGSEGSIEKCKERIDEMEQEEFWQEVYEYIIMDEAWDCIKEKFNLIKK